MDAALQKLKRIAKQGDTEDKARYLAALVKSGVVARNKVILAGDLGLPEALLLEPQTKPLLHSRTTYNLDALNELSLKETIEYVRQELLSFFSFAIPEDILAHIKANTLPSSHRFHLFLNGLATSSRLFRAILACWYSFRQGQLVSPGFRLTYAHKLQLASTLTFLENTKGPYGFHHFRYSLANYLVYNDVDGLGK